MKKRATISDDIAMDIAKRVIVMDEDETNEVLGMWYDELWNGIDDSIPELLSIKDEDELMAAISKIQEFIPEVRKTILESI